MRLGPVDCFFLLRQYAHLHYARRCLDIQDALEGLSDDGDRKHFGISGAIRR